MCIRDSSNSGTITFGLSYGIDQTVWYHFVARSSSQQHGAKENVSTPRMETNVAPLRSQDVKMQQKRVSPLSDP